MEIENKLKNLIELISNVMEAYTAAIFINDGSTIIDNETGDMYCVLERSPEAPDIIVVDRDPVNFVSGDKVLVVPPPVGGGRDPCIGIFQKIIKF